MKTFKYLINQLRSMLLHNELILVEELKNENFDLQDKLNLSQEKFALERFEYLQKIEQLNSTISALNESIIEDRLEYFWNHKIKPLKSLFYNARSSNRNMNVLRFLNEQNDKVTLIEGGSYDELALNCLEYVKKHVTYSSKKDLEMGGEYWKYANETILDCEGDCEDGSILMANLMLKSGIPSFRVRVCVGHVKGGYHAYTQYLRVKDNKWYVLDWCYWPKLSKSFKLPWSRAEDKYFSIDWSFNKDYGFRKSLLDRTN